VFGKYGLAEFHVPRVSRLRVCVHVCARTHQRAIYARDTRDRRILARARARGNGDFENANCDLRYRGIINLPPFPFCWLHYFISFFLFFFFLAYVLFFNLFHSSDLFYSLFAVITDASIVRSIILHDVIYGHCSPREFSSVFRFAARDNTFESRPDVISSPVRNAEELCRNA